MKDFNEVIDNQQFYHHFQSIIDIREANLLGFEGLLRSEFIKNPEVLFDMAIKSNRLYKLDTSSIHLAIQTIKDYQNNPNFLDYYFFLNIYPSMLTSPRFIPFLDQIVSKSTLSPRKIILEINESEIIKDMFLLRESVTTLKELGFQIALDDIGKGRSSFEKILELQPEFVKLDKFFSSNLHNSKDKQKVMEYLVHYFSDFKSIVVLEGIETKDDLLVAKSLGVQFVQGYVFGKPGLLKNQINNRSERQRKKRSFLFET